jgi:hypothetical protein
VPQIFNGQRFNVDFSGLAAHHGRLRSLHAASGVPEGAAFRLPGQRSLSSIPSHWLVPTGRAGRRARRLLTRDGGVSAGRTPA